MKKNLLKLWLCCFALGAASGVFAQSELKNIINYGLAHSREMKKTDWQREEAKYLKREVVGNGLPQVEASASYSKMMLPGGIDLPASIYQMVPEEYATILDGIAGLDQLNSTSANVQVTQLIYSQAFWVGLKTAKKNEELYKVLQSKTEDEVIAEIANTYYQIGSLMLQHETVNKSTQNLSDIYRMTELKYNSDLVKETDLNRLKVSITNLEVTKMIIENAIKIQLNYLKAITGMPLDSNLSVSPALELNLAPADGGFVPEYVPAFKALLKQNEIYGLQVKKEKANYYPTLAAYGKFQYSSYSTEYNFDSWTNLNTIGLSLTIPIFYSGSDYAKVKQAQFKQAQLQEDIKQTRDMLFIQYNNALLDYNTAQKLLAVQAENRKLAERVYMQTHIQYEEGLASMADLLNVNSDFLQADNSYNQQILKCKTAEIKMLSASGKLKTLVTQ
jgi:outer membrane protein TolC